MSHNIGRIVAIPEVRIGPDSGAPSTSPGVWESSFVPEPALVGGAPRFVILHLTSLDLPGASRVEVELGYDVDVITAAAGPEAWSRPVDPAGGPIVVRFVGPGPAGGVSLAEYGSGEPWTTTYPPEHAYLDSVTNGDVFLHTDPYDEPTYQPWLQCGGVFDWQNAACAAAGSTEEATARAVGMLVAYHLHDGVPHLSSCSVTLIDTNFVLTARHCVADPGDLEVRSGSVTFDYATLCAGGRPSGYAPGFHKVRGVVARGDWPASIEGDWAILEIDPPPAGVVPRALRSLEAVAGEAVFTVHHPNGAVKKLEAGTLTSGDVGSVANFDYAGGSSGSALFDSMGRVIGAALSAAAGAYNVCQVAYSPARSVLDALASPPAPPAPFDIMLVMDRSGSMSEAGTSGPGRTKMDEAREAASLFVQLVRKNAGDRMGMVSFSSTASVPVDTAPGNVNPGKKNQLVGPAPYTGGSVGTLTPGGATSIGDGLQKAMEALGGLPASANQRAILLMTDGMQNTAPLVEAVEPMLGDAEVNVVGFGTEARLDGALLSRLAGDHAGLYTRANDGLELKKFFALSFGNIFESGMLMDPQLVLERGEREAPELSFDVCDEDQVTVVVGWDDPTARLEAVVVTPGGVAVPSGGGVEVDRGTTWWFIRIPLPVGGEREGRWRIRVGRGAGGGGEFEEDRSGEVRAFVSILASGGPRLRPIPPARRLYTGDTLNPKVALLYPNGTAPYAETRVTVEGPGASLGELVVRHGLRAPDVEVDPADAFLATLQRIAAESGGELPIESSSVTVRLYDDGAHDDGAMDRDGVYGNPTEDLLRFEGTYTLHAVATYGDGCRGRREAMWSVHVEPGIDPERTGVEVVETGDAPDGGRRGTLRITPRDRYGNALGPGRSGRFRVTPQPGSRITGPVADHGDGSYGVPVAWDPAAGGPGLVVSQPERDPVPVAPPTRSPWWCRPWLFRLLAALVLLLAALLVIVLVT